MNASPSTALTLFQLALSTSEQQIGEGATAKPRSALPHHRCGGAPA